jgi:hypothetical protein
LEPWKSRPCVKSCRNKLYASRWRLGGVLSLAMENYGIFRLWVKVSDLSRALHNIPVHTTIPAFPDRTASGVILRLQERLHFGGLCGSVLRRFSSHFLILFFVTIYEDTDQLCAPLLLLHYSLLLNSPSLQHCQTSKHSSHNRPNNPRTIRNSSSCALRRCRSRSRSRRTP